MNSSQRSMSILETPHLEFTHSDFWASHPRFSGFRPFFVQIAPTSYDTPRQVSSCDQYSEMDNYPSFVALTGYFQAYLVFFSLLLRLAVQHKPEVIIILVSDVQIRDHQVACFFIQRKSASKEASFVSVFYSKITQVLAKHELVLRLSFGAKSSS